MAGAAPDDVAACKILLQSAVFRGQCASDPLGLLFPAPGSARGSVSIPVIVVARSATPRRSRGLERFFDQPPHLPQVLVLQPVLVVVSSHFWACFRGANSFAALLGDD
jgi:hypothetical protein